MPGSSQFNKMPKKKKIGHPSKFVMKTYRLPGLKKEKKKKDPMWKSYDRGNNHNVFLDDWIHFHFHLLRNERVKTIASHLSLKLKYPLFESIHHSCRFPHFFSLSFSLNFILLSLIQVIWPSSNYFSCLNVEKAKEKKKLNPALIMRGIIEPVFISFTFTFYILFFLLLLF